jgi:hypothetical protein
MGVLTWTLKRLLMVQKDYHFYISAALALQGTNDSI